MVKAQAFTCRQAARLAGFDNHMMVDYLCRHKLVVPSMRASPGRGRARLFTFWDVVLLRAINRVLSAGIPVARLKKGIADIQKELRGLTPEEAIVRRFVVTDGHEVILVNDANEIVELTNNGQFAFAFVLDAENARREVLEQAHSLIAVAP